MNKLILFWHRNDLRLSDRMGLNQAREESAKIIGVFCLDPNILGREDIAPVRVAYLIGCLKDLEKSYQKAGSQLLILHQEPVKAIPQLAQGLKAEKVYWSLDVEPYSQERDRAVESELKALGIEVKKDWDRLLHFPGEILTGQQKPYTIYTPFWKNWIKQTKAQPKKRIKGLEGLSETEENLAKTLGVIPLPTAKELGFDWENGFILEPGEKAAKNQLEYFIDRAITEYEEQRNIPALEGTSQLSAALKFGVIGIRTLWEAAAQAYENSRSEEAQKSIETWQKEIAWREFYQHALHFFPELEKGPYRKQFKEFPWENNPDYFTAWCQGKTGYPIVDAAMRQLNETGWMHNRCRMIVASFLTKDLIIDWRWGEKYFMQHLCDGDLAANNGGWQWSTSSGMDPKPLRIFNPISQAKKFDPEGEYIRQWLPELNSLDSEYLVTGKIPPEEREYCNYPHPIIEHKIQQKKFKQIYQQQKE